MDTTHSYAQCTEIEKRAIDRFIDYVKEGLPLPSVEDGVEFHAYPAEMYDARRKTLQNMLADKEVLDVVMFYAAAITGDEKIFNALEGKRITTQFSQQDLISALEIAMLQVSIAQPDRYGADSPEIANSAAQFQQDMSKIRPLHRVQVTEKHAKAAAAAMTWDGRRQDSEQLAEELNHNSLAAILVGRSLDGPLSMIREYVIDIMKEEPASGR